MRPARIPGVCAILTLIASFAAGQSLWSPDAGGLLSAPAGVRVGDLVLVEVDASTALSFRDLRNDSRGMTVELAGGGSGELLSFLPSGGASADRSVRGSSEVSLRASIGALVQEVNSAGLAFVRGERSIALENREESVSVSGWLRPADLEAGRSIGFDRLAEARVVFRTVLQARGDTLRAEDLRSAEAPSVPAGPRLTLTEEKKRELLLESLNRIVDILFD